MKHSIAILFALVLLSGCFGNNEKRYIPNGSNTLTVNTTTDSSFFNTINTKLHIYKLLNNCSTEYIGTQEIEGTTRLNIPTFPLLLTAEFYDNGWSQSWSSSADTMLKNNRSGNFHLDLSYQNNIYDIRLYKSRDGRKTELKARGLHHCQPW